MVAQAGHEGQRAGVEALHESLAVKIQHHLEPWKGRTLISWLHPMAIATMVQRIVLIEVWYISAKQNPPKNRCFRRCVEVGTVIENTCKGGNWSFV